jgi:hypothetical protein
VPIYGNSCYGQVGMTEGISVLYLVWGVVICLRAGIIGNLEVSKAATSLGSYMCQVYVQKACVYCKPTRTQCLIRIRVHSSYTSYN